MIPEFYVIQICKHGADEESKIFSQPEFRNLSTPIKQPIWYIQCFQVNDLKKNIKFYQEFSAGPHNGKDAPPSAFSSSYWGLLDKFKFFIYPILR